MTEPLRVLVLPRKPVRVAVDVHEPPAQATAPCRVAVCPDALVAVPDDVQLPPPQVCVAVRVPPRGPLADEVRFAAMASKVATASVASNTKPMICFFMTGASIRGVAGCEP